MTEKRIFEKKIAGVWVECLLSEVRKGDIFRWFDDAAKTTPEYADTSEYEATTDAFRHGVLWAIRATGHIIVPGVLTPVTA